MRFRFYNSSHYNDINEAFERAHPLCELVQISATSDRAPSTVRITVRYSWKVNNIKRLALNVIATDVLEFSESLGWERGAGNETNSARGADE